MKKTLLFLLIIPIWNSFAQKTQDIQAIPPPAGIGCRQYFKIDIDNDGYAAFEIDAYINYIRSYATSEFGNDLSGYTLQLFPSFIDYSNNSNPITTSTYTNTTINTQTCFLRLTYVGGGPQYTPEYLRTRYYCYDFKTISSSGDFDQDSVPNVNEDVNSNGFLYDDDTDGTGNRNFLDNDDDGDSVLTINEDYNANGNSLDDDADGDAIPDYLDPMVKGRLLVNLLMFIQGFYADYETMHSVKFNQDGVSPLTDVEEITVELHKNTFPYELVTSTTAMLKTNGRATCLFPVAPIGNYYFSVKCKNAIETWSAYSFSVSTTMIGLFSFRYGYSAYGSNQYYLGGNVSGLYSGDINQDGSIDASDATDLTNDIENSAFGVKTTDLNGDGSVDASDLPMYDNNQTLSIFCNRP